MKRIEFALKNVGIHEKFMKKRIKKLNKII